MDFLIIKINHANHDANYVLNSWVCCTLYQPSAGALSIFEIEAALVQCISFSFMQSMLLDNEFNVKKPFQLKRLYS